MLKDSLGGNAKVLLIATISSNPQSIAESISTLRFASRAKLVKNNTFINLQYDGVSVEALQEGFLILTKRNQKIKRRNK